MKLLTLAKEPPDNPASWDGLKRFARYEVTPIDHDYAGKTPAMWNAVHRAFGMDAAMAMVVGNPTDAAAIVDAFRSDPKYVGGGSGSGFKERVYKLLDEITPLARAMGAVNIIKKLPSGKLLGDNTDGVGYARSLEKILSEQRKILNGAKVMILGAGGTGRSIAFALGEMGAQLTILNRTEEKATDLAQALNAYFGKATARGGGRQLIEELLPQQDAVVSTVDDAHSPLDVYSTLGLMGLPVTSESIRKNEEEVARLLGSAKTSLIVSDIRLRKEETPMLRQAHELGFKILNGVPMVVNQGVAAFWWMYQNELEALGIEITDIEDIMWQVVQ